MADCTPSASGPSGFIGDSTPVRRLRSEILQLGRFGLFGHICIHINIHSPSKRRPIELFFKN